MHIGIIAWGVVSAALFLVAVVTAIAANLSVMAMVDEMNVVLPPEKRIRIIGYGPGKTSHLFSAYPALCPDGTSGIRARRRIGLFISAMVVFALFFFGMALAV